MESVLSPVALIEQLEQLSPADLESEIQETEDRLLMMRRLLAIIKGEPLAEPKVRKPRQPRAAVVAQDAVAKDTAELTPEERVAAFLVASGPATYQELLRGAGLMPKDLSPVLKSMSQVKQLTDKRYMIFGT